MTKTEPARRNKRPLVSSDQFLEDVAGSGGQRIETRDRKDATRADEQRGSVSVKITAGQYSNRDKSISKNWGYKRRRAQFMHDVTQDVPNTATAPQQFFRDPELSEPASQTPFELNLCKCSNICKHFEQQCHNINGKQRYLGYLSSTKAFKHFVYAASGQPNSSYGSVQQSPITLLEFIKNATDDTMTMIDQLIIVQKLAVTVLQFWTTPWLQEQWELQQIALFRTSTGDTQSVLRTLHLSALFPRSEKEKGKCIPRSQHPKISDSVPPALKAEQKQCASQLTEPEVNSLLYGVQNMTICSLGIALLQIGFRKPIESLRQHRDYNNVFTARRLAKHGTAHLGPKYKAIVQKCLSCDFRSGFDLQNVDLQSAFYTDVVCGLEDIIRGLGAVSIQDPLDDN